jgi:hypothetical protein
MSEDELLFIPDADAALLGTVWRCGQAPFVVYDYEKLVDFFVGQGMTDEEAEEWISYNIEGAWVGDSTPGILRRFEMEE